jgi:hypothetical protein
MPTKVIKAFLPAQRQPVLAALCDLRQQRQPLERDPCQHHPLPEFDDLRQQHPLPEEAER